MLWAPMDEERVMQLAATLTHDMEGEAEGYRTGDRHEIVAMESEEYRLPTAEQIPARMKEFSAYLKNNRVHPLLKAAVAQAYILAVRPFDEGNERLSRIVSDAILLRSGYDFFRDISISGVIARETYRYFAAMKEIHRDDNGGDLTYFMEYYFGLLGRALDLRAERARRQEERELKQQREMALLPIEKAIEESTRTDAEMESSEGGKEVMDEVAAETTETVNLTGDFDDQTQMACKGREIKERVYEILKKKYDSPEVRIRTRESSVDGTLATALNLLTELYVHGKKYFDRNVCRQLMRRSDTTINNYLQLLRIAEAVKYKGGLGAKGKGKYSYMLRDDPDVQAVIEDENRGNSVEETAGADAQKPRMISVKSEVLRDLIMIAESTKEHGFTIKDAASLSGMSVNGFTKRLQKLVDVGIIKKKEDRIGNYPVHRYYIDENATAMMKETLAKIDRPGDAYIELMEAT